jgi:hypothetical protein
VGGDHDNRVAGTVVGHFRWDDYEIIEIGATAAFFPQLLQ